MKSKTLLFLIIITVQLLSAQNSLPLITIDYSKKNRDTIKLIFSYPNKDINIEKVKLFIDEGFHKEFPKTLIEEFNSPIPYWHFIKRKSFYLLGFELRNPKQIQNFKYWTPGEVYTVGIEIIYVNSDKVKSKVSYVLPFRIVNKNMRYKYIKEIPLKHKFQYLPESAQNFITADNYFVFERFRSKIIKILEQEKNYLLILDNNYNIKYDKPPKRPDILGSRLILYFIGAFIILLLSILALFEVYYKERANKYLNKIEDKKINEIKEVIKYIVQNEKDAPYILKRMIKSKKFNVDDCGTLQKGLKIILKANNMDNNKLNESINKYLDKEYIKELEDLKKQVVKIIEINNSSDFIVLNTENGDINIKNKTTEINGDVANNLDKSTHINLQTKTDKTETNKSLNLIILLFVLMLIMGILYLYFRFNPGYKELELWSKLALIIFGIASFGLTILKIIKD